MRVLTNVHLENGRISKQFYLIIWIEYALIYMTKNCFSAAMASIVYEGVLTKSQTGLISAMFFVFYGPLQIVGGILADRYNPENLIKIGLIGSAFLNLLLFFFHDFLTMVILWGLNGVAQFAIWPAIVKIITSQLAPADRKNGAFYITFASVGGLLLSYLTAAMITKWEYNFLVSGGILFVLACLWITECHKVDHYLIPDAAPVHDEQKAPEQEHPTGKLFLRSGFYFIVFYFFLRTIVDQSVKSFSPTMLMEMYPGVTPQIGNLLNLLIIGANLVGAFFVRKLYPRYIRSEVAAVLLVTIITLPFCGLFLLGGNLHLAIMVASLCVVSCFLNCSTVLINCCNIQYAKYGKSATTAGIINFVASVAFIVVNYGVALLADYSGWQAVLITLLVLALISTVIITFAVPLWKRFTKSDTEE